MTFFSFSHGNNHKFVIWRGEDMQNKGKKKKEKD